MMAFDVPHVFRVFDGPRGLLSLLDTHVPNHDMLRYGTVQQWQLRRQIPARWLGPVLYVIEREGHSCQEFLTDSAELVSSCASSA